MPGRWSLEEMEEVYDKEGCQGLSKVFEVVGCKWKLGYGNKCGGQLI